jgi:hypothetical protein
MEFLHIAPSHFLHELNGRYQLFDRKCHLTLAHLVEEDKVYTSFYNPRIETDFQSFQHKLYDFNDKEVFNERLTRTRRTDFCPLDRYNETCIILDNSAFEMYQRGLSMFPGDKLIELGKKIKADYIVMPDYPGEDQWKTITAAAEYSYLFKKAGFGTFFVPQGKVGDLEGYIEAFAFAATSPTVDYIGISIIGVPNAYGVYRNPLQRYLSRKTMMGELYNRGLLQVAKQQGKKIHFLGMLDGPNEILEVAPFARYIDTWDSSAAVWAGIEGVSFDDSPTGLVGGKVKSHVDFGLEYTEDQPRDNIIKNNVKYIDRLVGSINEIMIEDDRNDNS